MDNSHLHGDVRHAGRMYDIKTPIALPLGLVIRCANMMAGAHIFYEEKRLEEFNWPAFIKAQKALALAIDKAEKQAGTEGGETDA